MGFQAHPTAEGVLYSSGHPAAGSGLSNPLGFMVSRNGGVTWEPIALQGKVDFHVMAVYEVDGKVIYGWTSSGDAGLYRSTDGGQKWQKRPSAALANAGGAFSLAIHPEDPDHVLAGTQDGLWRTVDGGESWDRAFPGTPVTAVRFYPGDGSRAVAYFVAGGTGLALVEDGGTSRRNLEFLRHQMTPCSTSPYIPLIKR